MVPTYSFMNVPIEAIYLSENRDLLFELSQVDALTLSAHIVDHNLSRIVVRNDTDLPVTPIRRTRLGKVLEYEAEGYFPVAIKHAIIEISPPRKWPHHHGSRKAFKQL